MRPRAAEDSPAFCIMGGTICNIPISASSSNMYWFFGSRRVLVGSGCLGSCQSFRMRFLSALASRVRCPRETVLVLLGLRVSELTIVAVVDIEF